MNAFSGRNRYQAAPHTSRNTASSTAKSVRRIMGLPPTRLGGFLPSPSHQFDALPEGRLQPTRPTIGNQWLGCGRPEVIEGGPWGAFTAGRSRVPRTGAKDGLDKLFGRVAGRRSVLGRGEGGSRQLHSLLVTVEVRDAPRALGEMPVKLSTHLG